MMWGFEDAQQSHYGWLEGYSVRVTLPELDFDERLQQRRTLLKDMPWITSDLFSEWAQCNLGGLIPRIPPRLELLKEMQEFYEKGILTAVRPRVRVDYTTSASQLFFFGSLYFAEGSGLYFFIRWQTQDLDKRRRHQEQLQNVLRALGENGLGGERSGGFGRFSFKPKWQSRFTLELPARREITGVVTLSLYHPLESEVSLLRSYRFTDCSGWAHSPFLPKRYRRRVVKMVTEGSTIARMFDEGQGRLEPVLGHLVDVTPPELESKGKRAHRIYRYGFAFPIPVTLPRG